MPESRCCAGDRWAKTTEKSGTGLIELKVNVGPGYRIYIADDGKDSLTLAGRKNTQNHDIKTAKA